MGIKRYLNLQDWNLTIRLFSIISRCLTPQQKCSWYILKPQPIWRYGPKTDKQIVLLNMISYVYITLNLAFCNHGIFPFLFKLFSHEDCGTNKQKFLVWLEKKTAQALKMLQQVMGITSCRAIQRGLRGGEKLLLERKAFNKYDSGQSPTGKGDCVWRSSFDCCNDRKLAG